MSLYKHQEDIIIAMLWQLGHTAYRRKSPKSSVFKGIVTAMFEEVMMLLMTTILTRVTIIKILTTVTIIIERSKAKCLFGASTSPPCSNNRVRGRTLVITNFIASNRFPQFKTDNIQLSTLFSSLLGKT